MHREDEPSLIPDYAAGNCHARKLPGVLMTHKRLSAEKGSGVLLCGCFC